jgi:muramoyltetrapeptide carboxypeptidase LdcA involved in peptidoglycan recycling
MKKLLDGEGLVTTTVVGGNLSKFQKLIGYSLAQIGIKTGDEK